VRDDFLRALDRATAPVAFWLRDDDATVPGAALDHLLRVTADHGVPVTLAVIPAPAGVALAERLLPATHVTVAVHGWAHVNHAGPGEKKQELGGHRPLAEVTGELRQGLERLARLFPGQLCPVLVPPWNRIAPEVTAALPGLGFTGLSVFGPEKQAGLPVVNTHVDLIDWRGTRGGRDDAVLFAELAQAVARGGPVGVLTHHLVHDAQAWGFLERLFALTRGHPGCRWVGLPELAGRGRRAM
jgi:peptidoglycan/xylan/chitin deacetylase (PgdA/CDA1 family)